MRKHELRRRLIELTVQSDADFARATYAENELGALQREHAKVKYRLDAAVSRQIRAEGDQADAGTRLRLLHRQVTRHGYGDTPEFDCAHCLDGEYPCETLRVWGGEIVIVVPPPVHPEVDRVLHALLPRLDELERRVDVQELGWFFEDIGQAVRRILAAEPLHVPASVTGVCDICDWCGKDWPCPDAPAEPVATQPTQPEETPDGT
ncbi:MAG: hypothetical protein JWO15_3743 [Sphingomonadales bacterium]|nr:hypothetical protein [Sphingomonadales bacterium]